MHRIIRLVCLCAVAVFGCLAARAQTGTASLRGVEPGYEEAVRWQWRVAPSIDATWGLALPAPPPVAAVNTVLPMAAESRYVVKKGDALILIAKRFKITVEQLKYANALTNNLIRIGQELTIPTPEEIAQMPPALSAPERAPNSSGAGAPQAGVFDAEVLLFQIALDREGFAFGPIDGKAGLEFSKLMYLYQMATTGTDDLEGFRAKAKASVGELLTTYILRPEDFRFIAPPKAMKAISQPEETAKKKGTPPLVLSESVPYEELTSAEMLAYRSPWEFVAERFHCSTKFLRDLNPSIAKYPVSGTAFRVPNVAPFSIESALREPLQPRGDASRMITAVIVDAARLEIYRNDRLIAVFPVTSARPTLRGRGVWTILDAIPRPRMGTFRVSRLVAPPVSSFFVGETPAVVPPRSLEKEEFLSAGPNNPVGILWINLAKAESPEVLSFGLHGTSIPDSMGSQQGLGGFRMTNWDIARAVRLLPPGTPLHWKQTSTAPVQAAE